jgi:hypothetical protein
LQVSAKLLAGFRLFGEVQDSEAVGLEVKPLPGSIVDTVDVRQAYVEFVPGEASTWRFRVGRQALAYGEVRLIGSSNWGNVGPAWDAVDIAYNVPGIKVEAFASSPVIPVARGFDRPHTWTDVRGVYGVFDKVVPGGVLDAYGFWKGQGESHCGLPGGLSFYTWGFRAVGGLPLRLDYNTETAIQRGSAGTDGVRAGAGHYALGYTHSPKVPRFFAAYDFATGDGDRGDGRRGTFDQLYPTYKFGTADGFGWRNIHDAAAGADFSPAKQWRLRGAYHKFWLWDRTDALYSQFNTVFVPAHAASSGRVGDELEVRVEYTPSQHWRIGAGTARMIPGPYLEEAGFGNSYSTFFLMLTFRL